jgi:hypothetical protein
MAGHYDELVRLTLNGGQQHRIPGAAHTPEHLPGAKTCCKFATGDGHARIWRKSVI